MSSIDAKVIGHINLIHKTHYKIEIMYNGYQWFLYRRFSDFDTLHKNILKSFTLEQLKLSPITFPDKALASTFKFIIDKRIIELNEYIKKILSYENMDSNEYITTFFDVENKGVSGLQVQYGENKIAKETFAKTKCNKTYHLLWTTNFIVLLKTGELLILNSIYDNTSKAEMNLIVSDCTITPKARNNSIIITDKNKEGFKLIISFSNAQEVAYWIRALSDFSVSTTVQADTKSHNEVMKRKSQTQAAEQHAAHRQANVEHIHAKGTGNTVDQLSQYGI